jgi:hypothetical protein
MRVAFLLCVCLAAGLSALPSARGQDFIDTTQDIAGALADYVDEQSAIEPAGIPPELITLAQEQTLADPNYLDHYTRRMCGWLVRMNVGLGETEPHQCGRLLTRFSEEFLLNLEIDVAFGISFADQPTPRTVFQDEVTWLTLPTAWLNDTRQQKALVVTVYLAYADAIRNAASMQWSEPTVRFIKGYLQAGVETDLEMRALLPLRRRNPFRFGSGAPGMPPPDPSSRGSRREFEPRTRLAAATVASPGRVPAATSARVWSSPPFPPALPQATSHVSRTRFGVPTWIFWTGAPVALAGLGLLLRQLLLLRTRLAA